MFGKKRVIDVEPVIGKKRMNDAEPVARDERVDEAEPVIRNAGSAPALEPDRAAGSEREEVVVPVIEEELATGVREVTTGAVRVEKHVDKRTRRVSAPVVHEDVEVRRVPVNRVVQEAPKSRRRGDTVIVPVVEEELVVTKRLVLKEEIHLIKRRTRTRVSKEVEVGRERARVRRLGAGPSRPVE